MSERYQVEARDRDWFAIWDTENGLWIWSGKDKSEAISEAARLNADETLRNAAGAMREVLERIIALPRDDTAPEVYYFESQRLAIAAVRLADGKITHGLTCEKKPHTGTGYLHAEDDDGPYSDDGVEYCGRCHTFIGPGSETSAALRLAGGE